MIEESELIERLTHSGPRFSEDTQLLSDFAYRFGWRPSDIISVARNGQYEANTHLIVEHGLENAAVLTFAANTPPAPARDAMLSLLSVSYNNLVDWHICIDQRSVRYIYNRTDPAHVIRESSLAIEGYRSLTREYFEDDAHTRPNPMLPSVDDAVLDTISRWKRRLGGELGGRVSNESFSDLFNAILLIRTVEDATTSTPARRVGILRSLVGESPNLASLFRQSIAALTGSKLPSPLWKSRNLSPFDRLDTNTLLELFQDFYQHRGVPYRFDFSLMSRHAMSKIYERYVSLLHSREKAPGAPSRTGDRGSLPRLSGVCATGLPGRQSNHNAVLRNL